MTRPDDSRIVDVECCAPNEVRTDGVRSRSDSVGFHDDDDDVGMTLGEFLHTLD